MNKVILYVGCFILFFIPAKAYGNDYDITYHGHQVYLQNEPVICLAKNIYFEAANQSMAGKVAVANVVLNRQYSELFPNNVCDVIYQ